MYLNILSYEDKKLFFALANKIINIDGVVSDLEIELLEAFRNEMNLISIDDMAEYDIVDIVDSITDDKIVKKIVLFELLSLACVDSDFSEDEKNVLQSIKERWNISDELYDKLMKLASGLVDISNQISDTIMMGA